MGMCIYKDSSCFFIDVDTEQDLTDTTQADIKFKKPDDTCVTFTGYVFDTTIVRYKVQPGEIDQVGDWCGQALVSTPTFKGPSQVFFMKVEEQVDCV